jgi:hypothetical protein
MSERSKLAMKIVGGILAPFIFYGYLALIWRWMDYVFQHGRQIP